MPTSYTSLLGLALPVTGELSGTWGDTVNNYITQYVDAAVAGVQTISGSQTAVTLSVTNGSSLITAGSGATGSAQFQIINCTGNPAGLLTITAPASSRQYIIINGTSTAQSVKIVGTGPTTGVTLVSGEKAHVAWNGSDFVKIATQSGTGEFVTVDTTNLEVTNIKAKDGTAAATIADSTGAITVSTLLNVDNLRLDGNTLSSTDSNGNVVIAPNGTGDVQLDADTVRVGDSAAAVTLTSNGAGALTVTTGGAADLILNTNSGSTSGSITIGNGTNGNITVATNGTGDFYVDADTVRIGDSNANATITTNGTGDLILNTNAGTNSGSITIEDGVNGNIIIAPNGTGQVQISNAALDLTTIEVTNIKAKDGTASMTLADTTGIITLSATAGTANGVLYLNGSRAVTSGSALTLDSSGNLGLGVPPSAWSIGRVLQFENGASIVSYADNAYFNANAYFDSGWKYLGNAAAGRYEIVAGAHAWYRSTSAQVAGTDPVFSQAMTLHASGGLSVGNTNDPSGGSVNIGVGAVNSNNYLLRISAGTSGLSRIIAADTVDMGYIDYDHTVDAWQFYTSGTEKARITSGGDFRVKGAGTAGSTDAVQFSGSAPASSLLLDSSGNLGLGVTPDNWSAIVAFQVGNGASLHGFGVDEATLSANTYYNGGYKYAASSFATQYQQQTGQHRWFTAPSGTAGNAISFTQAMTLDASGRLGIGETNPDGMVIVKNTLGSGVLARFIQNNASFNSDIYINHTSSANNFIVSRRSNGEAWLYQSGAEPIAFYTNATERARITSTGQFQWSPDGTTQAMTLYASGGLSVGNTTDPGVGNIGLTNGGKLQYSATAYISPEDNIAGARIVTPGVLNVATGGTAVKMTLDASGNLLVGTTTTTNNLRLQQKLATVAVGNNTFAGAALTGYSGTTAAAAPVLDFNRSRGTTDGSMTVVASGDTIGYLAFRASDGTNFVDAASIRVDVDGTPGTNDMPGRIVFLTSPDGSTSQTERARITSGGDFLIGTTTNKTTSFSGNGTGMTIGASLAPTIALWDTSNSSYVGSISQIDADMYLTNTANGLMVFSTNNTERARITSGGYFKASNAGTYQNSAGDFHELRSSTSGNVTADIRHTNNTNPYGIIIGFTAATPNGTGNYFLNCLDSTAQRAEIRSNGGLANYQSNNVDLSDIRTKTDISPLASYWNKIAALEIVTYKYKDQTHDDLNIGVIAQQVEQVAPEFVDPNGFGETIPEDGVPLKTIYNKDLTFAAIKALQEAMARIEQLEAKVSALENKGA